MTLDLMSRHSTKWRARASVRTRTLKVDDFDNALSEYESTMPFDMEIELSEMPKAKRVRMVTLKVENRERARFESGPIDLYADI
jgi:hypothetical protein